MRTVTLDSFIRRRFGTARSEPGPALEQVNRVRGRELWLNRWLAGPVLRRLSPAFARSNTVHPATANALYSLARALQPKVVFETGTYWGFATTYLAAAVADSGTGRVWSFDLYAAAGRHIPKSLRSHVELVRGKPSVDTLPTVLAKVQPELFFQDSLHDYDGVLSELRLVAPRMPSGAVILFHDFVAEGVRRAAEDGLPGWHLFQLEVDDPQQLGLAIPDPLPE